MRKKHRHLADLGHIMDSSITSQIRENLFKYIIENSSLPGPRANLELAAAFEEMVSSKATSNMRNQLWNLCKTMTSLSAEEAPTNDPREFIPFCGTRGLGAIGSVLEEYRLEALQNLRALAADSRWRMREAVAMALWRLLATGDIRIRDELENWIEEDDWLVIRAAIAGVAEPSLLEESSFASWVLNIQAKVLDKIHTSRDRKSDNFLTLRKALGYTLSVIVQATPASGFRLIKSLIERDDSDINWIIKQNLKKKRLERSFPEEVASLLNRF